MTLSHLLSHWELLGDDFAQEELGADHNATSGENEIHPTHMTYQMFDGRDITSADCTPETSRLSADYVARKAAILMASVIAFEQVAKYAWHASLGNSHPIVGYIGDKIIEGIGFNIMTQDYSTAFPDILYYGFLTI